MKHTVLKSDLLLLVAAVIWGFSFVAQRAGMEHVGPFVFNAIRFALGSFVLIPFVIREQRNRKVCPSELNLSLYQSLVPGGILAGSVLFSGASLQQLGIVYTTAGKAGFITGLYVIVVPLLGLFWKKRTRSETWFGAVIALMGLYLLSITESMSLELGDSLVLIGALFWAIHFHVLSSYSAKTGSITLALIQFSICSLLSFVVALAYEDIDLRSLLLVTIPILYAGLMSVGVAFTLQVVAQRDAHPAHAAILLSLEAVFAALGGWLILHESMSTRGLVGCGLMLIGMVLSQLHWKKGPK